MKYKGLVYGAGVLAVLGLAGCASVLYGGTQTTEVVVRGSATAYCDFYNTRFRNSGHFPNKISLERSRENLTADCLGEEGRRLKFTVVSTLNEAGTVGNIPTGVVPGVAYDGAMGSVWSYPDPIIVDFRQVSAGETVEWPVDAVAVPLVQAPKAAAMQPVLDMDPAVPARASAKAEPVEVVQLVSEEVVVSEVTTKTAPAAAPVANFKGGVAAPIISPEDHMGMNPKKVKAEAEAKRKAAADAKRLKAEQEREAAARVAAEKEARAAEAAAAAAASEPAQSYEAEPILEVAPAGMAGEQNDVQLVPEVQEVLEAQEVIEVQENAAPVNLVPTPFENVEGEIPPATEANDVIEVIEAEEPLSESDRYR